MLRLLGYLRRYRWRYAAGGLCLLLTATLAMSIPYLLKRAIDATGAGAPHAEIASLALSITLIAAVQAVVRTFSRALIFNVGRDVEHDLRNDLFAHLQRLPLAYYQHQHTGDLMSRVINDVNAVRMLLGPGILNLVNTPLYYVYAVAVMLSLDARLTVAALLPYPLLVVAVRVFSRRIMEYTLRTQEGLASLSSHVQETLSGIHVVRAYAAEERQSQTFRSLNEQFQSHSMDLARVRGQLVPLMKTAAGMGNLVVLWYGGLGVIHGRLSLGDLVAFLGYLNLLAWPTMALGWMLSIVQRGRAAMKRLEYILATPPQIADAPDAQPLPRVEGRIELRDVEFAYPSIEDGRAVLAGVSLAVPAGGKLAIVGRTGSGKSTLALLLPRLFDVTAGRVLVDGRDVRSLPLEQLRRSIAVVPQDPFLFSMSVRDNIAFGVDAADDEDVRRVARIAGVDEDIERFPRRYETIVGERGITLSGGQKQRITLARALLTDPRVLVLDDALSSVDTRTEHRILAALDAAAHGRTCIVIAHRVSTIADADLIAVIDDGRIVEVGNHSSLLERDGLYAELFRRQRLEEEIEAL